MGLRPLAPAAGFQKPIAVCLRPHDTVAGRTAPIRPTLACGTLRPTRGCRTVSAQDQGPVPTSPRRFSDRAYGR